MPAKPAPPVKPHVLEARKQRATQLLGERLDLERAAAVVEALVPLEDHPANEAALERARGAASDKAAELRAVAKAAGVTEAALLAEARRPRLDGLRDQIEGWQRLRDLHEDMATNPDAYGGLDLGGAPIVVEVQRRFVLEYDAAIAAARLELESLKPPAS